MLQPRSLKGLHLPGATCQAATELGLAPRSLCFRHLPVAVCRGAALAHSRLVEGWKPVFHLLLLPMLEACQTLPWRATHGRWPGRGARNFRLTPWACSDLRDKAKTISEEERERCPSRSGGCNNKKCSVFQLPKNIPHPSIPCLGWILKRQAGSGGRFPPITLGS